MIMLIFITLFNLLLGIKFVTQNVRMVSKLYSLHRRLVNHQAKVSEFVSTTKKWDLRDLKNILPDSIIDKIGISCFD